MVPPPSPSGGPSLAETIRTQRAGCALAGSPLYVEVLDAMAADVAAGGPCEAVLAPHAGVPVGDAIVLRLLAGVHLLVLEGEAPSLAAHYPSAGGRPGAALGKAFVETVRNHRERLRSEMTRGVQTNEVGRSVAVLTGLVDLAGPDTFPALAVAPGPMPFRLLEVGASAGLNLWLDRYRYEAGGKGVGPANSPVLFRSPWSGRSPDLGRRFEVVSREGCDRAPIDPFSPEGRLRLRSYVWPDQVERMERLEAALSVVGSEEPVVKAGDAPTWVRDRLARPTPGVVTVLFHTITFQYLSPVERQSFAVYLESAGGRATEEAPLAWLRMEPAGDRAEVQVTTWPGRVTRTVARSAYHGLPVELVSYPTPGSPVRESASS